MSTAPRLRTSLALGAIMIIGIGAIYVYIRVREAETINWNLDTSFGRWMQSHFGRLK
jgi:hypothetical protein